MPDVFVDGALGNDGNAGTAAAPLRTLAGMSTFFTNNPSDSTAFLAGTFDGEQTWDLSNLTNITIRQWEDPDRLPCIIRADTPLTGTWTLLAGEYWHPYVHEALPHAIMENWETRLDANGVNLGFMDVEGVISGIGSLAVNEWASDLAANRVYVRMYDDDSPNDFTMSLVGPGQDVPTFTGCTGVTLIDLQIWLFMRAVDGSQAAATGGGFRFLQCSNVTIEGCTFRNCGENAININGGAGSSGYLITGCTVYGQGVQGGFFGTGLTANTDVDDIVIEKFTHYATLHLDRNGVPFTAQATVGVNRCPRCFWFHAESDTPGDLTNIIVRNGFINGYNDAIFCRGDNPNISPVDDEDFSNYPVQVSNVRCIDMRSIIQTVDGADPAGTDYAIAFKRCEFHCPNMSTEIVAGQARVQTSLIMARDTQPMYFESCDISCDPGNADGTSLAHAGVAQNLYFFNCILNITNTGTTLRSVFLIDAVSAVENIKCHQCLIITGGARPIVLVTGGSFVAANFDFLDNWYEGNSEVAMSDNAAFFSEAQWLAGIDIGSIFNIAPELINPPTNQEGILNGNNQRKTRKVVLTARNPGINRNTYSGNYGCYQYGHYIGSAAAVLEEVLHAHG